MKPILGLTFQTLLKTLYEAHLCSYYFEYEENIEKVFADMVFELQTQEQPFGLSLNPRNKEGILIDL